VRARRGDARCELLLFAPFGWARARWEEARGRAAWRVEAAPGSISQAIARAQRRRRCKAVDSRRALVTSVVGLDELLVGVDKRAGNGNKVVEMTALSVVPMDLYWIWSCEAEREGGALVCRRNTRLGARSSGLSLV